MNPLITPAREFAKYLEGNNPSRPTTRKLLTGLADALEAAEAAADMIAEEREAWRARAATLQVQLDEAVKVLHRVVSCPNVAGEMIEWIKQAKSSA